MRRVLPILLLACCGCLSGTEREWTFALSRSFYEDFETKAECFDPGHSADEAAAVAVVALIALPFVLDVVALPVTVTHDLIVMR